MFKNSSVLNNVSDATCTRWIQICDDTRNQFNTILTSADASVHERKNLQANVSQLCWYQEKFSQLSGRVTGAALSNNNLIHWLDQENAFENRVQTGCIVNRGHIDIREFLNDAKRVVIMKITDNLQRIGNPKVSTALLLQVFPETNLDQWFDESICGTLLRKIEEFNEKDLGWSLNEINNLVVDIARFAPLQGGLSTFAVFPEDIQNRKAVFNIQNQDKYCFLWCIKAALYPAKKNTNPLRVTSYKHLDLKFNIDDYENTKVDGKNISQSLSLHDNKNPENYQPIFHYTLIKNLSRLVCSQITKSCSNLWLCDRYLCHFEFQKSFEKHKLDCLKCNNVGLKLPNGEKEDDKILSLKDFKHIDKNLENYKKCLMERDTLQCDQHIFQSTKHVVRTVKRSIKALNWADNKRKLIDDSTDTLPWGYKESNKRPRYD
ncbi:Protein of unknown function [Cotesia congregata]|uniref:Uncharacterized protein n=1 Tax=Cotesia congregata TaxID=51543 RepID=A0A8J2HB65_COTCN|nr:Protein of unknown function [Cotesia congregata]